MYSQILQAIGNKNMTYVVQIFYTPGIAFSMVRAQPEAEAEEPDR
jgi:hypothetical protein